MRIASYLALVALAVGTQQSWAASLSFSEQVALMAGAQQIVDAVRRADAETVAAHTSHRITRLGISQDSILHMTQEVEAQTAAMGMTIDSAKVGQRSELYEAEGAEVCFIPYRLEIHMPGHKGRSLGFLIAVREDPKGGWDYLDGSILSSHPEGLRAILPGLPASIKLPEARNEFDN